MTKKRIIKILAGLAILLVLIIVMFNSCNRHDAKAPKEIITTAPIKQDSSVVFIPILIYNSALSSLIQSKIPDPLINENKNINIPVFNPVITPVLTMTHVPYQYPCDRVSEVTRHIPIIGNIVDKVVVHTLCDGIRDVETWVNQTIISRVNLNLPTEYMARLNNIHFDGNADTLHTHVVVDFRFKADIPIAHIGLASCGYGEPLAQVELTLISKIEVLNDGKLALSNKAWGITWNRACNLTALDISVESLMNLPIIKKKIESAVDDIVQNKIPNTISLKPQLEKIWPKMIQSFKVDTFGFLNLNISELSARNIFVSKDSILTQIGAICKPFFTLGEEKLPSSNSALPILTTKTGTDSLNINLLGSISFKTLTKYANRTLDLYKTKVENFIVKLSGLRLYQHADSLVVEVELKKPFRGKVYLWGRPQFDFARNAVTLGDIKYTIESEQLLAKLANRILQLHVLEKLIGKN